MHGAIICKRGTLIKFADENCKTGYETGYEIHF